MKKIITISFFLILSSSLFAQYKIGENFENTNPGSLPSGWTRYNAAAFPIHSASNWTVRDSGTVFFVGNNNYKSKSRSGKRSIAVTYDAGWDSTGNNLQHISNAWLVTPRFTCGNDSISFYATGGAQQYIDSIQVLVNTTGITPAGFTYQLGTISWPLGSVYGQFKRYRFNLSQFSGQQIAVGFRYYVNMLSAEAGWVVQLDDIYIGPSVGIQNISSEIPASYKLLQNYPNPFNPVTNISFQLPQSSFTILKIYDMLGREVSELVNEKLEAGVYKVDFDASNLSSGTYFYSLTTSNFTQTKKMTLLK